MSNWWTNIPTDAEAARIDSMLATAPPPSAEQLQIRALISSLECCHHKAARHVELIVEAIGRGRSTKCPGRCGMAPHPVERMWQDTVELLRRWLAGSAAPPLGRSVGGIDAHELFDALGEPTPLKRWQVRRVIDRILSFLDPARPYEYLQHPDFARAEESANAEFLFRTRRTVIRHRQGEQEDDLRLSVAIDMLMPCNWNFPRNLLIVLRAIGGQVQTDEPYAACGRNRTLAPIRRQMAPTVNALQQFCGETRSAPVDPQVLEQLGEPTASKRWLAASLAKTLQAQLQL